MLIKDAEITDRFLIEEINTDEMEKDVLNIIGIYEGLEVKIIGNGYLKGSLLVKNNDGLVIQINPYFTSKINGSIVKEKRLIR